MKTLLTINDKLLKAYKQVAHQNGQPLSKLVEKAMRKSLPALPVKKTSKNKSAASRRKNSYPPLPVSSRKGGLRPGIDLNNSVALHEMMDLEDAAPRH